MKELICFSISTIFVVLTIILTYNEHRGKFKFSKLLGVNASYLINYIIILFPYYLILLIKTNENNNAFLNLFYDHYSHFFAVLIIPLCNMVTRFLFNKVFDVDISDEADKKYKNVMYGLLYFILVISVITFDVDSILFIVLFLIGTHVDFSIKRRSTTILLKDIILPRMKVCVISIISFALLLIFENTFNCLYYLILPWIIVYILCIICLIIMVIHKKMKKT